MIDGYGLVAAGSRRAAVVKATAALESALNAFRAIRIAVLAFLLAAFGALVALAQISKVFQQAQEFVAVALVQLFIQGILADCFGKKLRNIPLSIVSQLT